MSNNTEARGFSVCECLAERVGEKRLSRDGVLSRDKLLSVLSEVRDKLFPKGEAGLSGSSSSSDVTSGGMSWYELRLVLLPCGTISSVLIRIDLRLASNAPEPTSVLLRFSLREISDCRESVSAVVHI
jgi:hypothetical protein